MTKKYEIAIDEINKKTFDISIHFIGSPKKVKSDNIHLAHIKKRFNRYFKGGEYLVFKGVKKNKILTIQNMLNEQE